MYYHFKIGYMKSLMFLLLCLTVSCHAVFSQGKYAGSMKKLIDTTYTDNRNIPGLSGWKFREGSIATELTDPELFMIDVYQKGTTYIAFFSLLEDSATNRYRILDVIELKNIKTFQVRSGICRWNKNNDPFVVGLLKPAQREYVNVTKAWRFNRDKRRFEVVDYKTVDCMNEGFGE